MGKRIRNYRSGDRAEDLGIFLMKAFCAMAPVPRQEDFGLADAVATLLRPEGKFWYAEDSFLVQFKSRSEKKLELQGALFNRWLVQDLSVLIGRVNLVTSNIELFTLGAALLDSRVHEAKGLVVSLIDGEEGLEDGILNLNFEKPILRWSVAETENSEFIDVTYAILKQWMHLERWNRRYFRAGVAREILWKCNEMPKVGEIVHCWTPAHGKVAAEDIEPLVQLLGLHVQHHPELWNKVHAIEEMLRGPSDTGVLAAFRPYQRLIDPLTRLAAILKTHPTADVVVTVQIESASAERCSFWVFSQGRKAGHSIRHDGTWAELKEQGFDCKIEGSDTNAEFTLSLTRYIANLPVAFEIIDGPRETPDLGRGDHSPCFFLRRLSSEPESTELGVSISEPIIEPLQSPEPTG